MRKWLNIGSSQSDYSADPEDEDDDADYDQDDPQNYLQNEGYYSLKLLIWKVLFLVKSSSWFLKL